MTHTVLIVGASRGLGHAMARELVARGWHVIGTVRDETVRTPLHDLADQAAGQVSIERLDMNDPEELTALHQRLAHDQDRTLIDILLLNAGTTAAQQTPLGEVSPADFVQVMTTNVLGPMRTIEKLEHLVAPRGLIAAMSSGQGSITNNTSGGREVYRASKAALNMSMRSFAARQAATSGKEDRAFVLLAPGWINTDLGGAKAPYTVKESTPILVDLLTSRLGQPGLAYLDRFGDTVPW